MSNENNSITLLSKYSLLDHSDDVFIVSVPELIKKLKAFSEVTDSDEIVLAIDKNTNKAVEDCNWTGCDLKAYDLKLTLTTLEDFKEVHQNSYNKLRVVTDLPKAHAAFHKEKELEKPEDDEEDAE